MKHLQFAELITKLLSLICALLIQSASFKLEGGWREYSTQEDLKEISSCHLVSHKSDVYLVGGDGVRYCRLLKLVSLENGLAQWEEVIPKTEVRPPTSGRDSCCCVCGSKGIFLFFGAFYDKNFYYPYFFSFDTKSWIYLNRDADLSSLDFALENDLNLDNRLNFEIDSFPDPNGGRRACVYDEKNDCVIVFGGLEDGDSCDRMVDKLWFYKLRTKTWYKLRNKSWPPRPRYDSFLVLDHSKNSLLVIGGADGYWYQDNHKTHTEVWSLSLQDLTWKLIQCASSPVARSHHTCCKIASGVLFFGGSGMEAPKDRNGDRLLCDVWFFSLSDYQWTERESAPDSLEDGAACVLDSKNILIFGRKKRCGVSQRKEILNKTYKLQIAGIPSLEEMCLKQLQTNIDQMSLEEIEVVKCLYPILFDKL